MTSTVPTLWRHPDFLRLWAAQAVSVLGSQITELALPLAAITVLGATPFQVGLLAATQYVPFLVIGLPAGAWVDRLPRRPVMVVADLVRFAALLVVPLASLGGVLRLWMLYPTALVVGVMTVFFDLAAQSFLPTLIGEDQLVDGNTKLQMSSTAGQLAGPGAGGLLVQWLTAPVAVLANSIGFALSALLLLLLRGREAPSPPRAAGSRLTTEIREGLRSVLGHPLLRPIALTAGLGNLFGLFGMGQAVLVLYGVRDLRLSPAVLGVVLAVANAGILAGSLLNARLTRLRGVGPALAGSAALMGPALLLLPLATPGTAVPVLGLAMGLAGFSAAVFNVNQVSLRQSVTPAAMRGRMTATFRFVNWGAVPVGTFLGGALAGPLGLRNVLWLVGAGSLLSALPVLGRTVRSLREIPAGPVHHDQEVAHV
ncbi:MFS transporter [Kitasatospora kazusensis]|uniref:MFS transporter n=1 Tax=Kitasatospora kazusensis TaxID=407974 RepID=A0ABN2ZK71_9ACTN